MFREDIRGDRIKRWDKNKAENFEALITREKADTLATFLDGTNDVNVCNEKLVDFLKETAKITLGVVQPKKNEKRIRKDKPWFNLECRLKRKSYLTAKLTLKRFKTIANEKKFIQICRECPCS